MAGSTCGFVTNPPTDDELYECQNILLPDEFDWDPSKICFEILQWRRSIGKVKYFITTSILLRADSHAQLQRSSVEMTRESMILIEQWHMLPLEWLRT